MKDQHAIDLDYEMNKALSLVGIKQLLDLIAQNSWWVPKQVYDKVKVVYPGTRRMHSKEGKRTVVDGIRVWTNEPAIRAFWMACGKRPEQVQNANICHIYESSVYDPLHFTNLANLTALPKSLESLSEWEPASRVLKYHSFKRYNYAGPNGTVVTEPDYYPSRWDHEVVLSSGQLDKVASELEHQRRTRAQYRRPEEANGALGDVEAPTRRVIPS